eukprot:351002-Chlamydomonas_euryale.AAC.7
MHPYCNLPFEYGQNPFCTCGCGASFSYILTTAPPHCLAPRTSCTSGRSGHHSCIYLKSTVQTLFSCEANGIQGPSICMRSCRTLAPSKGNPRCVANLVLASLYEPNMQVREHG